MCLIQNKPEATQCLACQTAKPGGKGPEKSDSKHSGELANKELHMSCVTRQFGSILCHSVEDHFCENRASDSGSGDPGSILGRVGVFVSLSKRHLLPKSTGNTQE